jgi:hypothetical protein
MFINLLQQENIKDIKHIDTNFEIFKQAILEIVVFCVRTQHVCTSAPFQRK